MSTAMDMILSASDSLSFQDMLDIDIKAEIDSLVGGHNDLSGLNFAELPPLELDDEHDIRLFSNASNHSCSSLNMDIYGEDCSKMVNPNAVMPVISLSHTRSPSPALKESHLTFSPSTIKFATVKQHEVPTIKKDLTHTLEEIIEKKPVIRTITKVTPVLTKPTLKTIAKTGTPTLLTFRNAIQRQIGQPISLTQVNNITTVRTFASNTAKKSHFSNNNNRIFENNERVFPKPAYSYSCLIAMALKNSRNGSLPVSEIYNFMCKHFPYFKTAPNGWKNSVRHNLSLNKCFEKIEKPAVNGSQRKGCLWAMNPAKINKMDEEVQKWSKKDPSAIKRAMVNPETLESLERGEMKFTSSYDDDTFGDSCGSAESEEGSESEQEVEAEEDNNIDTEFELGQLINVSSIQSSNEEESELEVDADGIYEELPDRDMLRVEVELAQKELFQYEPRVNNKRRRTLILQH